MKMNIARIMDAGQVRRYHTVPGNHCQTIAEHSWGVAQFVLKLCPGATKRLLRAALNHDLCEHYTGDVTFMVKRDFPHIKKALEEPEIYANSELGVSDPLLEESEEVILKIADMLELMDYSVRQVNIGNKYFKQIWRNGYQFLTNPPYCDNHVAMEIVEAMRKELNAHRTEHIVVG